MPVQHFMLVCRGMATDALHILDIIRIPSLYLATRQWFGSTADVLKNHVGRCKVHRGQELMRATTIWEDTATLYCLDDMVWKVFAEPGPILNHCLKIDHGARL